MEFLLDELADVYNSRSIMLECRAEGATGSDHEVSAMEVFRRYDNYEQYLCIETRVKILNGILIITQNEPNYK